VPEGPGQAPPFPGTILVFPHSPAISGGGVRQWQDRMRSLGFTLDADGVYGPQSKTACVAFQKNHGLSADGIVGRRTWDACFAS
jgi:peptidoglycan hydrolase-like protein with peptidoglycan-binding domain